MRPLELTRSGIVGTVALFLVAAVCVRLGLWQLDRRAERLERNAVVAERLAQPPVSLPSAPMDSMGLTHRNGRVRGEYDNARMLVLAGRSLRGTPGVHVFAPLRMGEGAILVNRGWLPSLDAATVDLAAVRVDTAVTVDGVLLPLPETGTAEPGETFRARWFRLDADAVRAQYPYPVSPLYLQAAAAPGEPRRVLPGPSGAPVPLPPPSVEAGPHLSYALQWFGFALIFVVGWAALVMRGRSETRGPGTNGGDVTL